jgi:ethanolamine-phosphate phospho-lyase
VCTGSEANELALRMARTATGREDVVVVEGGYHGHTSTLIDVSHYKFAGRGGRGAPDWVHVTPLPDPYRGRFRAGPGPRVRAGGGGDGGAGGPRVEYLPADGLGSRYANEVGRIVAEAEARGRPPAAFLAEPLIGCGGQIVPPPGWLSGACAHVRAAGGVCIADEVQVGFGRVGTHMWAFESQSAVPDIVTLGKPIGNGHPLAAVVTTDAIADAFDTGMEYFNTFGGNPVSCAIGLAVLDVLEEEGLQEHARAVGDHLLRDLTALKGDHPLIGDVRGLGLYLGVELVSDPDARAPATALARRAKERLRDHRILLSTDGPDDNVLKIKPPMIFSIADADRLVGTLDRILREDEFASRTTP